MDETFRKVVDVICECINKNGAKISNSLRFASDVISLYIINAENENIVGFSESILRETIQDILSTSVEDNSQISAMEQIPISSAEYESRYAHRKRRGSVSASGDPYAPLSVYPKSECVAEMLYTILENTRIIAQTMDSAQMKKLVTTMFAETIKEGKELIKQGEEYGKKMYLVESGEFQVFRNGKLQATLRKNSLFGEIALLYNCPRTATVVCTIEAKVWVVVSDAYIAILMPEKKKNRELACCILELNKKYANLSSIDKEKVLQLTYLIHFVKDQIIDTPESGVFFALENIDTTQTLHTLDAVQFPHVNSGKIVKRGTACKANQFVLFVPDSVYDMIREDK